MISSDKVQQLVTRLKNTKEDFIFFNQEKSIKFTLSLHPTVDGSTNKEYDDVQLCFAMSCNPLVHTIIEHTGVDMPYVSSDDEEVDVDLSKRLIFMGDIATELKSLTEELNRCYNMKVCECQKYFIYDDLSLCFLCELIKRDTTLEDIQECSICARDVHKDEFTKTSCCGQDLHTYCRERLTLCPFCRERL